jgi:peptide/nickel transport system substrate-binding protein
VKVRSRRISLLAAIISALAMFVAACGGSDSDGGGSSNAKPTQEQEASATKQIDINEQPADKLKQGGTVRWAVDQFSTQWNYNQVNGPEFSTSVVLYGVMPYAFIADKTAKVAPNPDYLTSAKADDSSGKQVVTIEINPKAKWSDGTPITEKDFETQWNAMKDPNGKYQISSSTGYDRIESVKQGKDEREVVATFSKPFADWMSLWSPLYPAKWQDTPDHFNSGYLSKIPVTAGPFKVSRCCPIRTGGAPSRTSTGSSPARSSSTRASTPSSTARLTSTSCRTTRRLTSARSPPRTASSASPVLLTSATSRSTAPPRT